MLPYIRLPYTVDTRSCAAIKLILQDVCIVPAKLHSRAGTLYLVHVLTHATRTRLDAALAGLGVSSFHFTILSVIVRNEGLSSARLSRRFHVTPQAMGETVLMLEKKGLVVRTEDPANRKALHLGVSAEGRALVSKAEAVVAGFEQDLFTGQDTKDIEIFRRVLVDTLATLHERPGH